MTVPSTCGQTQMKRSSSSDDGEDFLDLSSMSTLDDDVSWLYTSPTKPEGQHYREEDIKKKMLAVFESPEILHQRRALSHKLRDIERGASPVVQSLFSMRSAPSQSRSNDFETLHSSHTSSLDNSFNSAVSEPLADPQSASLGSNMNGANGSLNDNLSTVKPSPLRDIQQASSNHLPYSTGTFTRPKKKSLLSSSMQFTHNDNDIDVSSTSPSETYMDCYESNCKPASDESPRDDEMAAGDFSSSTFIRRRNQTRTIETSSVLEAQRMLADGSPTNGAEMAERGDSLSALPDESVRRRAPTGNTEDKSKRESLDIQTLAKLQEQSLRDSLSAVRKASNNTSSSGSAGVPGLSLSDLDSSTGSLSSSNEESFYQNAEENAVKGGGTFRIRKSQRTNTPSPTLELNGDTPILHKSVVNSRNNSNAAGSGRRSPQIRSSLSPRSIQAPKASGLRKPASSLPGPSQSKPRASGIVPPRSGLRPPSNSPYTKR